MVDFILLMALIVLLIAALCGVYVMILGFKDDISEKEKRIKKLEQDLDWWQEYADKIEDEKTDILKKHEERLNVLSERNKSLLEELDKAKLEIIEKDGTHVVLYEDIDKIPDDVIKYAEHDIIPMKNIVEANEIRTATKDLDFPPVEKVNDAVDVISDAIKRFQERQNKKEE